MIEKYVAQLLGLIAWSHVEHLNEKNWAKHKILDKLYKDLPELIDVVAEVHLGQNPTARIPTAITITGSNVIATLEKFIVMGEQVKDKNPTQDATDCINDVKKFLRKIQYLYRMS
ncbi:MAG: DUF5856 family protein [Fusobacteriaceae bacterium]